MQGGVSPRELAIGAPKPVLGAWERLCVSRGRSRASRGRFGGPQVVVCAATEHPCAAQARSFGPGEVVLGPRDLVPGSPELVVGPRGSTPGSQESSRTPQDASFGAKEPPRGAKEHSFAPREGLCGPAKCLWSAKKRSCRPIVSSVGPITSSRGPDTSSRGPELSSRGPDTSSRGPDMGALSWSIAPRMRCAAASRAQQKKNQPGEPASP